MIDDPGPLTTTLIVRDIADEAPLAGARFDVESADRADVARWTGITDEAGSLALPEGVACRLRPAADARVGLCFPTRSYQGDAGAVVWAYRTVRVDGTVAFSEPASGRFEEVAIRFAPTPRLPGEWTAPSTRPGSATWCAREHAQFETSTPDASGAFVAQVPACREVSLVVTCPGHRAERVRLDASSAAGSGIAVSVTLSRIRPTTIRVIDDAGRVPQGLRIVCYVRQVRPYGEFNSDSDSMLARWIDTGFTASGSAQRGTATAVHHERGKTPDADGVVRFAPPLEGERFFLVSADDLPTRVVREGELGPGEPRTLSLAPTDPNSPPYVVEHRGRPLANATLQLAIAVEDFTPALAPIRLDADGSFPARCVVPGARYYAIVSDPALGTLDGDVEFGASRVVDVSEFASRK